MSFLSSPGVHVREIDLTGIIPAVATTIGAIAMPAQKGPVDEITTVGSEEELLQVFGKPNSSNFEWWFTAASFLQYSDSLKVVRAESGITNAIASGTAVLIRDDEMMRLLKNDNTKELVYNNKTTNNNIWFT